MEKLTISPEEARKVQRKHMARKARNHLRQALHWINKMRELEKK